LYLTATACRYIYFDQSLYRKSHDALGRYRIGLGEKTASRFDTCARRTAHAQSLRFHTVTRKSVMPSGGDSGGNWIFLSIEHVLRHVNMFLILNQNLGVVYLSVCICMCMLSTLYIFVLSLLLSIGIEKSILSTVPKVKYSVSYRTENTWYRPPAPS